MDEGFEKEGSGLDRQIFVVVGLRRDDAELLGVASNSAAHGAEFLRKL